MDTPVDDPHPLAVMILLVLIASTCVSWCVGRVTAVLVVSLIRILCL